MHWVFNFVELTVRVWNIKHEHRKVFHCHSRYLMVTEVLRLGYFHLNACRNDLSCLKLDLQAVGVEWRVWEGRNSFYTAEPVACKCLTLPVAGRNPAGIVQWGWRTERDWHKSLSGRRRQVESLTLWHRWGDTLQGLLNRRMQLAPSMRNLWKPVNERRRF